MIGIPYCVTVNMFRGARRPLNYSLFGVFWDLSENL